MFHRMLKSEEYTMREINLTPLIDVSLVIVTMLLLTTPLAFESHIAVHRANASASDAAADRHERAIDLHIMTDEEMEIDGLCIPREALTRHLRPILAGRVSRRVVLRCEGNVSHGAFVDVMDRAKACGAEEIALLGN